MHSQRMTWAALVAVASIAVAVVACSGTRNGSVAAGHGQLAVNLVDAPNPTVDEIWVNVERVVAHSATGGWVTLSSTPLKVDLLKLQSQAAALGMLALPAGTITQIRLVVSAEGNYVVTGGTQVPLKVPSGCESGIKIMGPWQLPECHRTDVTLDFDGKNSIWYHPAAQGSEWILRPVIRVKKSETAEVGCTPSSGGTDAGSDTPPPAPAGAGSSCTAPSECLSATCTASTCAPGGAGVPCVIAADCNSGTCTSEGTCGSGTAGGTGAPCTATAECLSNVCSAGTCQPGMQGAPCTAVADCSETLACSAGTCVPPAAL